MGEGKRVTLKLCTFRSELTGVDDINRTLFY